MEESARIDNNPATMQHRRRSRLDRLVAVIIFLVLNGSILWVHRLAIVTLMVDDINDALAASSALPPTTNKLPTSSSSTRQQQSSLSPSSMSTVVVQPRAYPKVKHLPCYDDSIYRNNTESKSVSNAPIINPKHQNYTHGILFVKPMKVGGSTVSGVQLRIALRNGCQTLGTFKHTPYQQLMHRHPNQSFLFSWLRHPTHRVVSEWYHFFVSRKNLPGTNDQFLKFLRNGKLRAKDYYMKIHTPPDGNHVSNNYTTWNYNDMLSKYDFVGITERFEESIVAMQLLLGIETSDVLYVKAKSSGGYDGGGYRNKCYKIPKSNVSDEMQQYFQSNEWQSSMERDWALYVAANTSLDRTIDETIGRTTFQRALSEFQTAMALVNQHCPVSQIKFPCAPDGTKRSLTDCLWGDSGCGNACIDQVVEKYKIT